MSIEKGLSRREFGKLAISTGLVLGTPGILRAQTSVVFAVPNPSALTWLPFWAAQGEGYFEEEGLSLQLEAVDGSSSVLQAMAAGQAQIGAPGPGPLLGARARGVDVKFIYNMYPKSIFGLLVKEDSPVKTPEDLRGTVVGVGTADGAEVSFTRAILNDLGLKENDDYSLLPVGDGGTAAAAFLRDEVGSYAGAVSDAAILAARGIMLREITPEPYLGYFGNGVAMLSNTLASSPELAPKFGRALVRGMRFATDPDNQKLTLAHCAAGNPQEGEDVEFAAALLDGVINRMTPTDAFIDKGYGYQPPEHWEVWHESVVSAGAIDAPLPDLTAAYTNEFVEGWNA